jgi:hypothetical protein
VDATTTSAPRGRSPLADCDQSQLDVEPETRNASDPARSRRLHEVNSADPARSRSHHVVHAAHGATLSVVSLNGLLSPVNPWPADESTRRLRLYEPNRETTTPRGLSLAARAISLFVDLVRAAMRGDRHGVTAAKAALAELGLHVYIDDCFRKAVAL